MAVLTQEIEVAVQRLRAALQPEEIVLFGSRAYGTPRPDSDIDLLVVLHPTDEPQETRQRRAMQALGADGWRRVDGHVWAYTPEELHEQLRLGSTAVRDALAKGIRLFPQGGCSRYRELAGDWSATGAEETLLQKAREDLILADKALTPPVVPWGAAFHAQQAAEKAMKAFLAWHDVPFRKTHSLEELGRQCVALDSTLGSIADKAAPLTEYAWKLRNPGEAEEPDRAEAEAALPAAREVYEAMMGRLPPPERA